MCELSMSIDMARAPFKDEQLSQRRLGALAPRAPARGFRSLVPAGGELASVPSKARSRMAPGHGQDHRGRVDKPPC